MRHASLQANSMAGGKRALTRQRARGTGAALNPSLEPVAGFGGAVRQSSNLVLGDTASASL